MKQSKIGFSIVELVVAITIIAILSTLSFIYLRGYTQSARNTKVETDLAQLSTLMTSKIVEDIDPLALVSGENNVLSGAIIAGELAATGSNYAVGNMNYSVLDIKRESFLDPSGRDYILGTSTKSKGIYQLASYVSIGEIKTAKIEGNFTPRTSLGTHVNIISGAGKKIMMIEFNKLLEKGDVISHNGTPSGTSTITSSIILNKSSQVIVDTPIPVNATQVFLAQDESLGIIADKDNSSQPVINGGSYLPY